MDEMTEDQEPDEFDEPSVKGDIGEELKRLHKRLASLERKAKGFSSEKESALQYKTLLSAYRQYKSKYVKHFRFGAASKSAFFGEFMYKVCLDIKGKSDKHHNCSSGEQLPMSTLELVRIYFDTATFDEIERDKKIKVEAQLSLIGGTMGLLTGFSIISGIEIVFFLIRLV